MTIQQMILVTCGYMVVLVAVVYFTRATARRVIGALVGGFAAGLFGLGAIALCEVLDWWRVPLTSTPYARTLLYICLSITLIPIYPVTWRVARRFGRRGLAIFIGIVTVVGPPRDYLYAALFPEWMVFAPGVAPILADAVTYAGIVALGHAAMRIIAGPAREDGLARHPKETSGS